jgi:hypothetical protein
MTRKRTKAGAHTPVRAILRDDSPLRAKVRDGLEAMKKADRKLIDEPLRDSFEDSLDVDEAFRPGCDRENRWDYLLGHRPSRAVVALEPHSANEKEISVVIAKRTAAKAQLAPHLKDGKRIAAWLWVASGKVHFANTEKARIRLDENGILFVAPKVLPKHLP